MSTKTKNTICTVHVVLYLSFI